MLLSLSTEQVPATDLGFLLNECVVAVLAPASEPVDPRLRAAR